MANHAPNLDPIALLRTAYEEWGVEIIHLNAELTTIQGQCDQLLGELRTMLAEQDTIMRRDNVTEQARDTL